MRKRQGGCTITELLEDERKGIVRKRTAVEVPRAVLEAIEHVRAQGKANMADPGQVMYWACIQGYPRVAGWILGNEQRYKEGAIKGFVSTESVMSPTLF